MADTKISALTALAGTSVEQLADVLPIVDNSVTTTKKILVSELAQALQVIGTAQATTSGSTKDFTIPAWAKRVDISLIGVSTNGTSNLFIQIGDGGGIEVAGYSGAAAASDGTSVSNNSNAFRLTAGGVAAAGNYSGSFTLILENASAFTWSFRGNLARNDAATVYSCAGHKSTSAAMTTVRITSESADTFDAGEVNVTFS